MRGKDHTVDWEVFKLIILLERASRFLFILHGSGVCGIGSGRFGGGAGAFCRCRHTRE